MNIFFAVLSSIIYIIWVIPYMYHSLYGKVIPHPYSWTVWSVLTIVNTIGLFHEEWISITLFLPIIRTLVLIIWAIIWWYFIKKISIHIYDKIALLWAGLIIWIAAIFGISHAIIPSICIDILVLIPTIRKIWDTPDSEDISIWITTSLSQIFLLLSIEHFSIAGNLFWIYIACINWSIALLIFLRLRYLNQWKNKILYFIKRKLKKRMISWYKL